MFGLTFFGKIIVAVIVLVAVGIVFVFYATTTVRVPSPVACTAEAMQCPDGTYVGRTGPNCQFVCPPAATSTFL